MAVKALNIECSYSTSSVLVLSLSPKIGSRRQCDYQQPYQLGTGDPLKNEDVMPREEHPRGRALHERREETNYLPREPPAE